jgi:NADP-dependent 3-hydroxy acid dehydrogenase YdfG
VNIEGVLGERDPGALVRARAVAFAISQPGDVDINEIVLRPTLREP